MRNVFRRDLTNLSFLERLVRTFFIFGIGTFVVEFFYTRATSDWLIQCLLSLVFAFWTSLLFAVSEHLIAVRYKDKVSRSKNDARDGMKDNEKR